MLVRSNIKISKAELNKMTLAERVDAVLDTAKLEGLGIKLPEIHARMRQIMSALKNNLAQANASQMLAKTIAETAAPVPCRATC